MSGENKTLTPVWIVYVDGKRLDTKHEGALKKITVSDRLNGVGTCSLFFDISAEKLLELGTFSLESKISIHLGYKDDVKEVFDGEITAFAGEFEEFGHEMIEIRGCNVLHKLKHGNHFLSYENKTCSEALKEMLGNYSLSADIEAFGAKTVFKNSSARTDLDFLLSTAERYGKDVYAYGNKVYVKKSIQVHKKDIIFEWGKSLISFKPVKNIEEQVSECKSVGWDPMECKGLNSSVKIGDVPNKVGGQKNWTSCSKGGGGKWINNIADRSLLDEEDAKNVALGYLQQNSYKFMTATGSAEGNYKLFPGMTVNIKYVGNEFSGEYIADTVTHEFSTISGYTTSFTLKRNMC